MKKRLLALTLALMLLISTTAPIAAKKAGGTDGPPGWSVVPGDGQTGPGGN